MFPIESFQTMLDSTPIGYAYHELIYDEEGIPKDIKILSFNPAFLNIISITEVEARNKSMFQLFPNLQEDMPGLLNTIVKSITLREHQYFSGLIPSFEKWLNIHFFSPKENFFIAQLVDITNLIAKEGQIYYLSFHDKLTGLYNRAYFEEELKRLDNNRNLPLAIIMGDVNGLKIINDVFGHLAGDEMLITIGEILKSSCRKGDVIARWGGDEFVILLPTTSVETVEEIIERIMTNCKNSELDLQHANISLGYAIKEDKDTNIIDVLVEAEDNMYKNKILEGKKVREVIIASMIQFLFDGNYEIKYHIDRIRNYIVLMSRELNLAQKEEDKLLLLADTHDIGKISLPKELLGNPGTLSESEWDEMKKHSETGYRIAKSIPELMEVADLILYHHEYWDGSGYPQGLKGEEIPYLVRIFSVIDTYDALTQEKAYRKAMTQEEAIDLLISQKEKQLDPDIVDIFLKIIS